MYRLGGIIPLLLGMLLLVFSYRLSLGSITDPGPGLWPFLVSGAMISAAVALLLTERDGGDYEPLTNHLWLIGLGLVSLGCFIVLLGLVGFTVSSLLILIFWLRFLGEESWWSTLIVSVLSTVGFYLLFIVLLGVPLPEIIHF